MSDTLPSGSTKVPATIVTGFLGAGKTTLVRHLMQHAGGRRIAIIVNEFGALGIDGDLLRSCGIPGCEEDNIVELANGCLCCTVADDFLPTMQALLDRPNPPEHILIETSGLALPKPLLRAFNWPGIRSRVTVDGVVTVVDGPAVAAGRYADDPAAVARQREEDPSLDHDNPLAEVYEDQLLASDLVVLNKTDLMDAAQMAQVRQAIDAALPRAVKVVPAQEGRLDPAVLLGIGAAAEADLAARPSHHDAEDGAHEHDDFESFVVPLPEVGPARRPAVPPAPGGGSARHPAHEGLRQRAGQADAPAGAGRRRPAAAPVRPRLEPERGTRRPPGRHRPDRPRPGRHTRRVGGVARPHAPAGPRNAHAGRRGSGGGPRAHAGGPRAAVVRGTATWVRRRRPGRAWERTGRRCGW